MHNVSHISTFIRNLYHVLVYRIGFYIDSIGICKNPSVFGNRIAKNDTPIAVVMLKYAKTNSCSPPIYIYIYTLESSGALKRALDSLRR